MWILLAFLSAFFAGITAVLAKCGIKQADSTVATAIRTIVVLLFSCIMVFIVGSQDTIPSISKKTWIFLILSGCSTGASWLCYFRALQIGNINKVVPIDKASTTLTILLAFIILGESITWLKGLALIFITAGTYLMIQKNNDKKSTESKRNSWLIYAVLSAVFASLTTILGKIGIEGVESNLGTAIRTAVVLLMAWIVVFATKKQNTIIKTPHKELVYICLSGLATGASWLCYFKALKDGQICVVIPIDKLSILITIMFSYLIFKEKLSVKALIGLVLIVTGTLAMI
ncbi:MAG: EamA family transporter [Oscillospiraceae bacterium]|jgi:transporter family protein